MCMHLIILDFIAVLSEEENKTKETAQNLHCIQSYRLNISKRYIFLFQHFQNLSCTGQEVYMSEDALWP